MNTSKLNSCCEMLEIHDIALCVLSWISDGTTYKAANLVCSLWHQVCSTSLRWMVAKYSNHLETLMERFPNKFGGWHITSRNPNIPEEVIRSLPDWTSNEFWDWIGLMQNPNISIKFIDQHPIMSSMVHLLSNDPRINWDFIESHPNIRWNWESGISCNPNITWDLITSH